MNFTNTLIETTVVISCSPFSKDEKSLFGLMNQWLAKQDLGYLKRSAHRLTSEKLYLDFYICVKNRHYGKVITHLDKMIAENTLPSDTLIRTQGSWLVQTGHNSHRYELIDELVQYSPQLRPISLRRPEAIAQALSEQRIIN